MSRRFPVFFYGLRLKNRLPYRLAVAFRIIRSPSGALYGVYTRPTGRQKRVLLP